MTLEEIFACKIGPTSASTAEELRAFESRFDVSLGEAYFESLVAGLGGCYRELTADFGDVRDDVDLIYGCKSLPRRHAFGDADDIRILNEGSPEVEWVPIGYTFVGAFLLLRSGRQWRRNLWYKAPRQPYADLIHEDIDDFLRSFRPAD